MNIENPERQAKLQEPPEPTPTDWFEFWSTLAAGLIAFALLLHLWSNDV